MTVDAPFYANTDTDTQGKLNFRFDIHVTEDEGERYENEKGTYKYRDSVGTKDRFLMEEYLCKKDKHENMEWDGYAMNSKYKSDKYAGDFHAEMVLCEPRKDLKGFEEQTENVFNYSSSPFSSPKRPRTEYNYGTPPRNPFNSDIFKTPGGKKRKTKRKKSSKKRKNKRKTKKSLKKRRK